MNTSLVPAGKVKHNPQTLAFHFPSMSLARFCKISSEYLYWKMLQLAEQSAHMNGSVLVPRDCLHWQRRKLFQDRRMSIMNHSFYQLKESEMTDNEKRKFALTMEQNGVAETSEEFSSVAAL